MLGVMDLRRLNADFVVGTAVFEQRGGSEGWKLVRDCDGALTGHAQDPFDRIHRHRHGAIQDLHK